LGFGDSAKVKFNHDGTWLRQIRADMVPDSNLYSHNVRSYTRFGGAEWEREEKEWKHAEKGGVGA